MHGHAGKLSSALPNRAKTLHDFARDHSLRSVNVLGDVAEAVYWVESCEILLALVWTENLDRILRAPTAGLLMNLLARNRERVVGALLCIAAGCGPASEAASRAAIEMSSSILYILSGDRCRRLLSYFNEHVQQTRVELERWRTSAEKESGDQRETQLAAVASRHSVLNKISEFVHRLREPLGIPPDEPAERWPKVSQRFEDLGLMGWYRTVYARLCAQTHGDAEDTLGELAAVASGVEGLARRQRTEAAHFSRFLAYAATSMYLRSVEAYMLAFDAENHIAALREADGILSAEMLKISELMGVPDEIMARARFLACSAGCHNMQPS